MLMMNVMYRDINTVRASEINKILLHYVNESRFIISFKSSLVFTLPYKINPLNVGNEQLTQQKRPPR